MKKIIIITILLLSSIAFSGVCNSWSYKNSVDDVITPTESGKYYAITKNNTFSNGESIEIGKGFSYNKWKNDLWYKTHWISCSITNIEPKAGYSFGEIFGDYESCFLITLDCSVEERTQFYDTDVKYTDLKGYRRDGTLQWTRNEIGSTDIYCYNKSGMNIVKRVNDPQYCK